MSFCDVNEALEQLTTRVIELEKQGKIPQRDKDELITQLQENVTTLNQHIWKVNDWIKAVNNSIPLPFRCIGRLTENLNLEDSITRLVERVKQVPQTDSPYIPGKQVKELQEQVTSLNQRIKEFIEWIREINTSIPLPFRHTGALSGIVNLKDSVTALITNKAAEMRAQRELESLNNQIEEINQSIPDWTRYTSLDSPIANLKTSVANFIALAKPLWSKNEELKQLQARIQKANDSIPASFRWNGTGMSALELSISVLVKTAVDEKELNNKISHVYRRMTLKKSLDNLFACFPGLSSKNEPR